MAAYQNIKTCFTMAPILKHTDSRALSMCLLFNLEWKTRRLMPSHTMPRPHSLTHVPRTHFSSIYPPRSCLMGLNGRTSSSTMLWTHGQPPKNICPLTHVLMSSTGFTQVTAKATQGSRTKSLLQSTFWWASLPHDVETYVKACQTSLWTSSPTKSTQSRHWN